MWLAIPLFPLSADFFLLDTHFLYSSVKRLILLPKLIIAYHLVTAGFTLYTLHFT